MLRVASLSLLLAYAHLAQAALSPDAERLIALLDSADVEHRWPAKLHVDWETGIPDGKPEHGTGKHTHCSAFVAAMAKRLGIYILRPPDHSQVLLANAQYEWLDADGPKMGWRRLNDAGEAQAAANRGQLVLVAYRNHHDDKPGHIAIVRPSEKSEQQLRDEGPEITQAGGHNYRDTNMRVGFGNHPAAFIGSEARFYAHAIVWPK